jgi:hypothetical protein
MVPYLLLPLHTSNRVNKKISELSPIRVTHSIVNILIMVPYLLCTPIHYVKSSQQENFRLSYYFDPIFFYWEKYYICLLLCQYYVVSAWRALHTYLWKVTYRKLENKRWNLNLIINIGIWIVLEKSVTSWKQNTTSVFKFGSVKSF